MMEITATVDPALYAVKLTATGAVGTVDWYRRSGGTNVRIGSGAVLWDYTAALNRPYEYVATDDASTEVAGPVTIAAARPVLSSTMSPIARQVTVIDSRPVQGEGQSVWHPVLGRRDPFVTVHPSLYPSGLLRLLAPTAAERDALIGMLDLGEPLLLRSTCPERVDTMTFVMQSWRDPFTGVGRKHGPAYLEIEFQRITDTPAIAPPAPDRTYATVAGEQPTYQALAEAYSTYRALLDGPR